MDRRCFTLKAISVAIFSAVAFPSQSYANSCELGFDDVIREMGSDFSGKLLKGVGVGGVAAGVVVTAAAVVNSPLLAGGALIVFSGVAISKGLVPGLKESILEKGSKAIENALGEFHK